MGSHGMAMSFSPKPRKTSVLVVLKGVLGMVLGMQGKGALILKVLGTFHRVFF